MPLLLRHLSSSLPSKPFTTLIPTFLFSSSTTTSATSRVALYFRRAALIDAICRRLLRHDSATPFPLPSDADRFVAAHAIRTAPSPDAAVSLFRSLPSHSHLTLHALAKVLTSSGRAAAVQSLLDAVDGGSFPGASSPSPFDRLRWFAAAGDLHTSLRMWDAMRASSADSHPSTESYNLIMDLYVRHGMDADAVGVFQRMIQEGAQPDSRTYTVIIEHLVRAGKLGVALQVFDRLPLMRARRTSKQYNALAEGLLLVHHFDGLKRLVSEMRADGIMPGRAVRAALSGMREAGHVQGIEEFMDELSTDDNMAHYVEGSGVESGSENEDAIYESSAGCDSVIDNPIKMKPWLDPDALANALGNWDKQEVEMLEEARLVWTTRLVCKLLRGFKVAETAWKFFCWVTQTGGFTHNRYTISRMMAILARAGHVDRLVSVVKSQGILLPFSTIRLTVDLYGASKKHEASLRILREASSLCGPLTQSEWILLCSSVLHTIAKCMRSDEVMRVLKEVILGGILLDMPTFAGLMQFFATEGDLMNVNNLFGLMRRCGIEPDQNIYQVLINAHIKHGRLAFAFKAFGDMQNLNLSVDVATKSLLVRSLWEEGKRREAVYVEDRSGDVKEGLPVGLADQAWLVSSTDRVWAYNTYINSILKGQS